MSSVYDQVIRVLTRPPGVRETSELKSLESWFRRKSKLFESLATETLINLIKECEFNTVEKNTVIVQQGKTGDKFFIILRGRVSVLIKSGVETEAGDTLEGVLQDLDRIKLGTVINILDDGKTFGELALVSEGCVRNASCVADESTDLIIVHRDLYNQSVSELIRGDFQERIRFVEEEPLFNDWPKKWKQYVAASLVRELHGYQTVLTKQGAEAENMYFIISGEVSIAVEPAAHEEQFSEFRSRCGNVADDNQDNLSKLKHFSLVNWLSARSRVSDRLKNADRVGSDVTDRTFSADLPEFKVQLSPSAIRRKTAKEKRGSKKINVCYLSKGHIIGDTEFLLDLEVYHSTVTCTQPTVTMSIHRTIFERIFKKKNPLTFKQMCVNLRNQIPHRFSRMQIMQHVTLMKYIMAKIHELSGDKSTKKDVDDTESLPYMDSTSNAGSKSSRVKSGFSVRSFPMTRRSEDRLMTTKSPLTSLLEPAVYGGFPVTPRGLPTTPGGSGDANVKGSQQSLNKASRAEHLITSSHATPPDHPRHGIFIKLLQISNPMVRRSSLDVDDDEYMYLIQLKRRMAKTIEDYYPTPSLSADDLPSREPSRAKTASKRKTTGRRGTLPSVPGASRGSPRKTAMKRQSAKIRPSTSTRQKSVFFSLP